MKRVMDIIIGSGAIIIISPIMLVIAVLIKVLDPGPAIYKQKRYGQYGKEFYIYKFRTMVVNAEQLLKENTALYEEYLKNSFSIHLDKDPRITRIGRFLRKYSLDELPQLFNVVKGEMSLVGPRPIVLNEIIHYANKEKLFWSVKPGLTGYWQAYGRSDIGYPLRAEMELNYILNRNMWLDIKIVLKTIVAVALQKGAY